VSSNLKLPAITGKVTDSVVAPGERACTGHRPLHMAAESRETAAAIGPRGDGGGDPTDFAIEFAYAAIDEAGSAALDAELARAEADALVSEFQR